MNRVSVVIMLVCFLPRGLAGAESTKVLIGSWSGKATGAGGGPPSGDIQVTFAKGEGGSLKGKISGKGEGGLNYSGKMSTITVRKRLVPERQPSNWVKIRSVPPVRGP